MIAVRMRVLAHWLIQGFDVTSIALPAVAAVPLGRAQPPKYLGASASIHSDSQLMEFMNNNSCLLIELSLGAVAVKNINGSDF